MKHIANLLLATLVYLPLTHTAAVAETHLFEAVTDFPIINAGKVPFYADLGGSRNVLAINAANDDHRSRFARAELDFNGTPGIYDFTLNTLGELDGDCVYQLMINGVVQGTVINASATTDYDPQQHKFENISVPDNAVIGVSAVALSNGKIPEGTAYAFARGRWKSLSMVSDDSAAGDSGYADLALVVQSNISYVAVGAPINYTLTASNQDSSTTATSPIITVELADTLTFGASAECQIIEQELVCVLPELPPLESTSVTLTATASQPGASTLVASVDAHQTDLNILNNVSATTITASSTSPTTAAAVAGKMGAGAAFPGWLLLLVPVMLRRRGKLFVQGCTASNRS